MPSSVVLVTGGAGFIGSHTARLLLDRGYRVVVLDNLYSGSRSNVPEGAELVVGDVADRETLARALRGVDHVVHLAAIVSVDEAREDPWSTLRINVLGTLNVLEQSYRHGVGRVVYASSCAVYGEQEVLPITEEAPLRPINIYGASKLSGEALVHAYREEKGLSTVALRYFNVYGPGMRGGPYAGVVYKFLTAALRGEPLTIHGDGEQTRDFVYVADVARANLAALESDAGGAFNIGTGVSITIKRLAEMVLEVTGSRSPIVHSDPRPGDIRHSRASISRARRLLGWEPLTDLKMGLEKTVEWLHGSGLDGS